MEKAEKITKGPRNPFLDARRAWNEHSGATVQNSRNWRLMAVSSSLGVIGLLIILGVVLSQQKIVPYVVELNGHSEAVRVVRADVMAQPSTNQIRAALRTWIIGARTVYGDFRAGKNQIDTAYAMTMLDSPAYRTLVEFHRENNPYERAQKETVEIAVNAVVAVSDNTWQIEWTETTKQISGRVLGTKAWQGSFTVAISPPTEESQILVNPIGVYVRQFSWTQRI